MSLNHFLINRDKPVLFIAEIGGNHEGDFSAAKALLKSAASTGAQVAKFQIYSADKLVSAKEDQKRWNHFKKFELAPEQYFELASITSSLGIEFMASIWDGEDLDLYDEILPIYKIGSGDLTNTPLLRLHAERNKPLILSTAMSNIEEIRSTVNYIARYNPKLLQDRKLAILHCVAMYGDPQSRFANLSAIPTLKAEFPDAVIGYSDHTVGTLACEIAIGLGAEIIEKHFTNDKSREFRDHHISADEEEMRQLVERAYEIKELIGTGNKIPVKEIETEIRIEEFRRAVYPRKNLKAGTVLTSEHLTTLRPNKGIPATEFFQVVGKTLMCDVEKGAALSWNWLS